MVKCLYEVEQFNNSYSCQQNLTPWFRGRVLATLNANDKMVSLLWFAFVLIHFLNKLKDNVLITIWDKCGCHHVSITCSVFYFQSVSV